MVSRAGRFAKAFEVPCRSNYLCGPPSKSSHSLCCLRASCAQCWWPWSMCQCDADFQIFGAVLLWWMCEPFAASCGGTLDSSWRSPWNSCVAGLVALYGDKVFPSELLRTINGDLLVCPAVSKMPFHCNLLEEKCTIFCSGVFWLLNQSPSWVDFGFLGHVVVRCYWFIFSIWPEFFVRIPHNHNQRTPSEFNASRLFCQCRLHAAVETCSFRPTHFSNCSSLSGLKKQDDIPLLVRFGKKEVQRRGCEELRKIILLLDEDMDLRRTDAIVHLLVTTIQLFLRFAPCQDYPMAGWQLTAKYNEDPTCWK